MAGSVHILCGPAGAGKTQRLLERYHAVARRGLGRALWLGPNQRTVTATRERLASCFPTCSAQLFCFQDFVEEIIRHNDPAARPLAHVQRRLLAEEIVAQLHGRNELSHFSGIIDTRGFAEGVLALLAELKRSEIWPIEFARAAYRRDPTGGVMDPRGRRSAIRFKDRQCARMYAKYQRLLIRHNLYDLEGRFWYARDLLARGACRPFHTVRAVFVDGLVEFTRTQHDMLQTLTQQVEELWIALPDEPGDERAELFTRSRLTLARLADLHPRIEHVAAGPSPRGAVADAAARPAGLAHLERQLFRPIRAIEKSASADGVMRIEAPGMVGEARMVVREIKALLLAGTAAEDVLVTLRDVVPYADLLREVFADYGVPVDVEGAEPLARNPAVAALLRALRLPEDDWPFAAVTALLRSSYFRADWPEIEPGSEVVQHAEVLLRLLGEARGRDAYLRAITLWADHPPPGQEDEQAEASRRSRKHDLALRCRPFLQRFFSAWDAAPLRATLADHVAWLRRFVEDLGFARSAGAGPHDALALERLWHELQHWLRLQQQVHAPAHRIDRAHFHRTLGTLANEAGLARTPRGPGRVRVLSTELTRTLDVPYLFVMGLGERSFPRLTAPEPFFDEGERQSFRQAGLDFNCMGDRMPDELLLFYQVVTRARRRLTLSYPAVDDKGQALLPSSFLTGLLDCFTGGSVPVLRRRMLIEGHDRDRPYSPAELRVRVTAAVAQGQPAEAGLPPSMAANLSRAARLAQQRLRDKDYGPYDGLLRDPAIIAQVAKLFGPDKVFSPTALEEYVACPFRFFADHVLKLEPLEEPSEEIESTDRGLVFHRALSRLHGHLQLAGIDGPTAAVEQLLSDRLAHAVAELATHASPAGAVLWHIEGQRLQKRGARYRRDWQGFLDTWRKIEVQPRPAHFEKGFGLPAGPGEDMAEPLLIEVDGVEVLIGGRIDRVDVAESDGATLFWIIDYKTGRSSHYSGSSLKSFERLQLTLYALAVERVVLARQQARPLGLAYWLVTDTGAKVVLPDRPHHGWFADPERWAAVRQQLESTVATLVKSIRAGAFPLKPRSEDCTDTCPFAQVCRITQSRSLEKSWSLPLLAIS